MTSGRTARARRREAVVEPPLPPALRAELRARIQQAAERRDSILAEAKRHKRTQEQEAARTYERIRAGAQEQYLRERAALEEEARRAARA